MRTWIISFALLTFAGASLAYDPKVNREGAEWLGRYSEPASTNISGEYHDKSWGKVTLTQAQGSREVTGTGDGWNISGVVSGKKVYLLFADKDQEINYCAELDIEADRSLNGKYSKGMMKANSKTRPIHLVK